MWPKFLSDRSMAPKVKTAVAKVVAQQDLLPSAHPADGALDTASEEKAEILVKPSSAASTSISREAAAVSTKTGKHLVIQRMLKTLTRNWKPSRCCPSRRLEDSA